MQRSRAGAARPRTRYRTRRFSPPPSPLTMTPAAPVDGGGGGGGGGAGPTVSEPVAAAETGASHRAAADPELPAVGATAPPETGPAGGKENNAEEGSDGPGEQDEEAGPDVDDADDADPAAGVPRSAGPGAHSHSSPLRQSAGPGLGAPVISPADAALIEISNHNFFRRAREHEAAVAHRVACEVALERVKLHKRLGIKVDEWDEELALEGLPPSQRWRRRLGPGGGVESKENRRP